MSTAVPRGTTQPSGLKRGGGEGGKKRGEGGREGGREGRREEGGREGGKKRGGREGGREGGTGMYTALGTWSGASLQHLTLGGVWSHLAQTARAVLAPGELVCGVVCCNKVLCLPQGNLDIYVGCHGNTCRGRSLASHVTEQSQSLVLPARGKAVVGALGAHVGKVHPLAKLGRGREGVWQGGEESSVSSGVYK